MTQPAHPVAGVEPWEQLYPDLHAHPQLALEETRTAALVAATMAAVERVARGEATAAGAPRDPQVELTGSEPAVLNDVAACERTKPALAGVSTMLVDPGPVTGSEDGGMLATAAGAPLVYWLLGCADPALFAGAVTVRDIETRALDVPSNHSPQFPPVIQPTLSHGIAALTAAARTWLPTQRPTG